MSVHAGHRKRLKERFRQEGLDSFDELHVLELLLFYCIPQKDTNPIAHALLDRFGSLPQVLEASVEELEKVPGVGRSAAVLLSLAPAYAENDAATLIVAQQVDVASMDPHMCGSMTDMNGLLNV